ncbi:MAG: hypothetical protein KAQ99_00620, partial [Candidatus Aureabacteria bacterium]|nr:hypothetical protein [Candidatus Auribacterota bacterium]
SMYLTGIADDGIITIRELLRALGFSEDQMGYSQAFETWIAQLYDKTITIDGVPYTFPSELVSVDDYRRMYEIIDAALGSESVAVDRPGWTNEQVAKQMGYVLANLPEEISAYEWKLLSVIGITNYTELQAVLNSPDGYTTSKGYVVTSKAMLAMLSLSSDYISDFVSEVLTRLFQYEPLTVLPVERFFVTDSDYTELVSKAYEKDISKFSSGIYMRFLNLICYSSIGSYLHELTHAQVDAEIVKNEYFVAISEGSADTGVIYKSHILDNIFSGKVPDRSLGMAGYKIGTYDFGLFEAMSRAVAVFYVNTNSQVLSYLADRGVTVEAASAYIKLYQDCAEIYKAQGHGEGRYDQLFAVDYLYYCLTTTSDIVNPKDWLGVGDIIIAKITNPAKFTFLSDGKIEVWGSDGRVEVITRALFGEWYCEGDYIYEFATFSSAGEAAVGGLSLSESITPNVNYIYSDEGNFTTLTPEVTLFPEDLGAVPASYYFVYYPDAVEMWYENFQLGELKWVLADGVN